MLTIGQRLLVDEFKDEYSSKVVGSRLFVALRGSKQFKDIKPVSEFTEQDKIDYMKERRTREHIVVAKKIFNNEDVFAEYFAILDELAEDNGFQQVRDIYGIMKEECLV